MSSLTILHKRNSTQGIVPPTSALSAGEIAINSGDGVLFTKTVENTIKTFLNSDQLPYTLDQTLSSVNYKFGGNTITGILAGVLGGVDNDVSGAGSTVVNGSDNDIAGDYAIIGNGSNNKILSGGDFGGIFGGQNNILNHPESFIFGSNITSHLSGVTYVNNLSATGKLYGDGSELTGVVTGSLKYEEISSNANLQTNKNYILLANNSSPTVTLPQTPSIGDYITFVTDVSNNNFVIIDRNGNNINELQDNLQCDIDAFFTLIYRNSQIGWKVYFK